MTLLLKVIALLAAALLCNGLEEEKRKFVIDDNNVVFKYLRRFMQLPSSSVIIGAPSLPSHLPEAEPILPGHTLIRPGLGMLKSAVKFPHRELEGGSGVYGNEDSLGLRYDGRNERVLYTESRRSTNKNNPSIILIIPNTNGDEKETSQFDLDTLRKVKEVLETVTKAEATTDENPLFKAQDWLKKVVPTKPPVIPFRQIVTKKPVKEKAFEKQPNFMGHYRKSHDVLEKLMATLLRYTGPKRRQQQPAKPNVVRDGNLYRIVDDNSVEDDNDNINLMKSVEATFDVESQTAMPKKQELFWKSKDLYTHIKIDQHAPEYNEFMPKKMVADDLASIRNWWFYNQADHKEFED